MKFFKPEIFLLIAFLCVASAKAQYLPERGEWFHFSYAHLNLLNKPAELKESWKSNGWQLMLMRESLFSRRSHWGVGYGLGFSSSFWHTNLNITTNPSTQTRTFSYLATDSGYTSNRFSASYVDIPFEIRYRTKSNHLGQYYRFYFGGLLGYRMNSYSAFKQEDYSIKYYKIDELARWHYGVFVRTGWWLVNVYAYYGINPVFSKNISSPVGLNNMHSLSLGLSVSL